MLYPVAHRIGVNKKAIRAIAIHQHRKKCMGGKGGRRFRGFSSGKVYLAGRASRYNGSPPLRRRHEIKIPHGSCGLWVPIGTRDKGWRLYISLVLNLTTNRAYEGYLEPLFMGIKSYMWNISPIPLMGKSKDFSPYIPGIRKHTFHIHGLPPHNFDFRTLKDIIPLPHDDSNSKTVVLRGYKPKGLYLFFVLKVLTRVRSSI